MSDKILSKTELEAVNETFNVIERTVITKDFWDEVVKSHEALRGMLVEAAALLSVRVRNDEYGYCYFCEQHNDPHTNACEYTGWLAKMREAGIVEGD